MDQWVALRPIFEVCASAKGYEGGGGGGVQEVIVVPT